jgi:hypothetical protein
LRYGQFYRCLERNTVSLEPCRSAHPGDHFLIGKSVIGFQHVWTSTQYYCELTHLRLVPSTSSSMYRVQQPLPKLRHGLTSQAASLFPSSCEVINHRLGSPPLRCDFLSCSQTSQFCSSAALQLGTKVEGDLVTPLFSRVQAVSDRLSRINTHEIHGTGGGNER